MYTTKNRFIEEYNKLAPNNRKIFLSSFTPRRDIVKILENVVLVIENNKFDVVLFINYVVSFNKDSNLRFPSILDFTKRSYIDGFIRKLIDDIEKKLLDNSDDYQKIRLSIIKTKELLDTVCKYGFMYTDSIRTLSKINKIDYYFLLAYNITENVPEELKMKWNEDEKLRTTVINAIEESV